MLAFSTGHMIATTVFLNRRPALRAFLGVCRYPVRCFRVILALLQPLLDQRTGSRLMISQGAPKAEAIIACTGNRRYNTSKVSLLDTAFDRIFTVWCWTPFEVFLVIHVSTGQEDLIPEFIISIMARDLGKNAYLVLSSAATRRSRDFESTIRLHPLVGHCILAASPSSLIF